MIMIYTKIVLNYYLSLLVFYQISLINLPDISNILKNFRIILLNKYILVTYLRVLKVLKVSFDLKFIRLKEIFDLYSKKIKIFKIKI